MNKKPICDIPSIKKHREDIRQFKQFKDVYPVVEPLLRLMGADADVMRAALKDVDSLHAQAEELSTLPDRFNTQLAARGWVMYEALSSTLTKTAAEKAEAGDVEGAERLLVDYYDEKMVRFHLQQLTAAKVFRPRLRLLFLALEDYLAERYHACVPVVLAQLDGAVSELIGHGFFAEKASLVAWDSISAHDEGIARLAKLFSKSRSRTCQDAITVPYRNGILHGRDLAYDTKLVAAKAWAALFSVLDFALKAEHGRLEPQPEEPKSTLMETLNRHRELQEEKARIEAWHPRIIVVGEDIPKAGRVEAYEEGSPERALVQFMWAWQKTNYGKMASLMHHFSSQSPSKTAGLVRAQYEFRILRAFELISVTDVGAALTKVCVACQLTMFEREENREERFNLIYESPEGESRVRGGSGTWKVIPL